MKKEIKNKRVPVEMLIDTGAGPEFEKTKRWVNSRVAFAAVERFEDFI